jgi:SPP1 gp7 family putative phage head morphogenesis protein
MQHNLREFLRHGGSGQYVFVRQNGTVFGYRAGFSIKSTFHGYADLRADFTDRLDRVIADNSRMLLNALTPPDTVPWVTEADLRDVSDAKEEALRQWDTRLTAIFEEYETHPQRLRPLRTAMEERLLRAFAGLVNQLRQQDLGIERYIWRSQDDAKVRDSHAEYDDQVFRWDEPPAGGHPGQAHNCRCFAEPIAPGSRNDVILAELALPAEAPVDAILRRLGLRAVAITPLGAAALAALAASDALKEFTRLATERRLQRAAEILGVDPGSAEGLLAAMAHELVQEAVISGLGSSLPKSVEAAQIAGQAAALYEMLNPGTIVRVIEGDRAAQLALGDFVQRAYSAFSEGRLRLQDGTIAQGWVEVFPELTEGERRLGELPGFTPERIDQWLETYPAEVLGLPNHTGSPPVEDPTGNIISTPIPDEAGPNIVEVRPGEPTPIGPNDDDATRRAIQRENESAQLLAGSGLDVVQNPVVSGPKKPDYLINGEIYDHYAPSTDVPRNIWSEVQGKVERGQTNNVVISLRDSDVQEEALRRQFEEWPIEGLREVIIIRRDGTIGRL